MNDRPVNKRQQARNEKALQDLIHNVPGNNLCADCGTRNPGWASWSLGIFLCMRCASVHRKLGTHISKVKSLSMDGWSNEQVENMKKVGNTTSNKLYNAQNKKPAIPIDADEADSAMERFIRSKYMQQGTSIMRSHHTGSTGSDETPPPLPPKTPGKFSFRSASSTFPLFRSKKQENHGRENPGRINFDPQYAPESPESGRQPKVTQTFGANLGYDSQGDTQKKLAKLRELGFTNDRKNETILKGLGGNLERTIEALVRLEGRSPLTSPIDEFPSAPSRPSVSTGGLSAGGLTVARAETARPATSSTNPFDISPAQPMSAQSTGNLGNFGTRNPFLNSNPFGIASQSNDAMNQAFSNMSVAPQPSQPLFPHHTGGLPNQQGQQAIYQQTMTPPMPSVPQNYAAAAFNSNQTYGQQGLQPGLQPAQPLQPMHTGYNPFMNNYQQQQQQQQQGYVAPQTQSFNTGLVSTPTGGYANNPFNRSPTRIASPTLGQIPEQSQPTFYAQNQQQQQPQQMNNPFFPQQTMNPYMHQQQQAQQAQQPQFQNQQVYDQFGQPLAQQQIQQGPQRPNTASIMALYNYPQLAPQPQQNSNPEQQQGQTSLNQALQTPNAPPMTAEAPPAPATMGFAGNNNPFMSGGAMASQPAAPIQNGGGMDSMAGSRSRDSMMASGMEWSNGRHSPDAFASLSARSR